MRRHRGTRTTRPAWQGAGTRRPRSASPERRNFHSGHAGCVKRLSPMRGETMERIEKSIEVRCPVHSVYNQWTQFEDFPKFMSGVKEVRQLDDTHVHWRAELWGKDKEWDAEIIEQVPDQRIAWRSTTPDTTNAGTVRFEPLGPDRTRVNLTMEYDPKGVVENVGDAVGVFSRRVENTVEDFKKFIESRGGATGGGATKCTAARKRRASSP